MQRQHLIVLSIIFTLLGLIGIVWYHKTFHFDQRIVKNNQKIAVLCTTSLIADAARQVGGVFIEAQSLMGPGVDPHLYRARESDIQALIDADIVFYNGLHLEGKMGELLEKMKAWKPVIAVGDCIAKEELLASEFAGLYDPHIWHDVSLWVTAVRCIGQELAFHYPQYEKNFGQQTVRYCSQLNDLNKWVIEQLGHIPQACRVLATAHDAFSYFGRAYNLSVVGLQGMSTDAEIGTTDIQNLVSFLVENEVPVIFVESSIAPRSIQAVEAACAYRGWKIKIGEELYSDALSDRHGPAATYIQMIKHNVQSIVKGLCI